MNLTPDQVAQIAAIVNAGADTPAVPALTVDQVTQAAGHLADAQAAVGRALAILVAAATPPPQLTPAEAAPPDVVSTVGTFPASQPPSPGVQ